MLRTSVLAKNFLKRNVVSESCHNIFFYKLKQRTQLNKIHSLCCHRQRLSLGSCKNLLAFKRNGKECSFNRYESAQAVQPRNENFVPAKSYFQDLLHTQKMQAHRSVLVGVASKEDIPFAVAYFEKYGSIASIYSYPCKEMIPKADDVKRSADKIGKKNSYQAFQHYLLLEFSSEASTHKLLQNCGFKTIENVFPVCSRLIEYVKKPDAQLPKGNLNINEKSNLGETLRPKASVSEVIQDIYESETLTELDIRLRFFLCSLIKDSISGLFPHCDVLPFGSSLNGTGTKDSDLDLVIRLYPEKVNGDGQAIFLNKIAVGRTKDLQIKTMRYLEGYLRLYPGMDRNQLVTGARVPILKMENKILNLQFDISVNNMSAVLMTDILHFCGEVDPRVRPLMYVVKKWAKEANITQKAPGTQISNFGLANIVLFFLQTRQPRPILPPLNEAFVIIGSDNSYDYRLQYLEPVEKWKDFASLNEESLAVLLKEFLLFVAEYGFQTSIISLMGGESRNNEMSKEPLCIQYLMEEGMNATNNVSIAEYYSLREKAKISANTLDGNLTQKVTPEDFSEMLGIPSAREVYSTAVPFNKTDI